MAANVTLNKKFTFLFKNLKKNNIIIIIIILNVQKKKRNKNGHKKNYLHYIGKSIGSPPSNERFDYLSNFHEYKS